MDSITRAEKRRRSRQARLMTLQQASDEFGPPYTSFRDLVIAGTLPRVRLGDSARIWVRRADIERLIATSMEAV